MPIPGPGRTPHSYERNVRAAFIRWIWQENWGWRRGEWEKFTTGGAKARNRVTGIPHTSPPNGVQRLCKKTPVWSATSAEQGSQGRVSDSTKPLDRSSLHRALKARNKRTSVAPSELLRFFAIAQGLRFLAPGYPVSRLWRSNVPGYPVSAPAALKRPGYPVSRLRRSNAPGNPVSRLRRSNF